jgi:para-aminobenzoate synthetase/4-amino-4-deoxychorismate lyase
MNRWHCLPAEVYALVERTPGTVLLESAALPSASRTANSSPAESSPDRFSRLFTAPARVLFAHDPAQLANLFKEIEGAVAAGRQAAGFFTYECGNCFEPKAGQRPSRAGEPLAWFGIYDRSYLFDHRAGEFTGGDPPGLAQLRRGRQAPEADSSFECGLGLAEAEYAERIAAIQEWIRSGDVYQLNFTLPLRLQTTAGPAALYRRLRRRQPAPYGAFLHWQPECRILSFSPELFFRLDRIGDTRRIVARPMKGTAPRGRATREDRIQAEWLRTDPKNRAENVMIVDLVRNDLGRLCRFGTVRAESLFAVERYPTLWQMTSTVTGELRPEVDFQRIFRALFPCGSVTGAPKLRAMQLIAELEREPRGVYTGAIGFFSAAATVFNVAIRTLELSGNCGVQSGLMGIGSGIVIDSDAADEFRECLLKAEFLVRPANSCPEGFSLVETLLWRGGYPLGSYPFIELHLDRLEDSADYFAFACDRAEAQAALLDHSARFADRNPRKVRLLLDREGNLRIASELLPEVDAKPILVRISSERTDPLDPMLFHKTTHRPLYTTAFQAAVAAGCDDALFLNLRGEVTESAIANLFVEKDGRWFTPPVECGLLAGVQRRHLLETRPNIEERPIHLEDLRQADAIYLANAVRGLRRIVIDWESL